MRLIQATVPADPFPDVKRTLDESGIEYFATHETGTQEYEAVIYISVPEEEVEPVLRKLYAAGLDSGDHVVLINTEVDIFGRAAGAADGDGTGHARIASAELHGKTVDLLPDNRTFVTMMVLATIVATTGVLLDSAAVVVGSMVLAPLFGPAVSASVGTVIDESDLFWQGVKFQLIGVTIAVAGAAVAAWVMKTTYLLPSNFALTAAPQIVERLSPDLLSLVVAFVAGVAGVISIATAAGRALVGVMMAAALLPPAAVIGIGLAWGEFGIAFHSGVLLAVNLLAINFAGLVTLWYLGYRPQSWIRVPRTKRALLKRGTVLFVAILVTSSYLWTVTYASAQRTQLESAIEQDVTELLDEGGYANVSLVDVRVEQDRAAVTPEAEKVIVAIGRPPGEGRTDLHPAIADRVERQVGHQITVDIHVSLLTSTRFLRSGTRPDQPAENSSQVRTGSAATG